MDTAKTKKPRRRENVKKWTATVLKAGFTWIPSVLFLKQKELRLSSQELNVLLQLACHWWKADNPPRLAKSTLADRMGVSPSTVQRCVRKLVSKGLLERVARRDDKNGQRSNNYLLKPLVDALHPLAIEVTKQREAKKAAKLREAAE